MDDVGESPDGASLKQQNLTAAQYEKLGDYVVRDAQTQQLAAITRDDVGAVMDGKGLDPELDWTGTIQLIDGAEIEVLTLWSMYLEHLKDYDLETVVEITHAPKDLIVRLANDIATIKPAAIHIGEGINHWFHATLANRAQFLPMMLTGTLTSPLTGLTDTIIARKPLEVTGTVPISNPIPIELVALQLTSVNPISVGTRLTTTVSPVSATQPITYHWQATDQAAFTVTTGLSSTTVFTWFTPGFKTITVTASNVVSTKQVTGTLEVRWPYSVYLPIIQR